MPKAIQPLFLSYFVAGKCRFNHEVQLKPESRPLQQICGLVFKSLLNRFIRRIFVVSNAIQAIDNESANLIIYCLNCIRHGRNSTYEMA